MIGIVVVSHSAELGRAAVQLALQMAGDSPPPIEVAAGTDDGFGTDAAAIADAIGRVDGPDGVLVVMDLGSAVLNAEMAVEFAAPTGRVVLSAAPLVEGLVAAMPGAAAGLNLGDVSAEADRALAAKQQHLGKPDAADGGSDASDAGPADNAAPDVSADVRITGKDGLHARPAAALVQALAKFHATVTIARQGSDARPASASSVTAIAELDVRSGDVVRVGADGPDAREAVDTVVRLAESDFAAGNDTAVPDDASRATVTGPAVFLPPSTAEPQPEQIPRDDRAAERERVTDALQAVAAALTERAAAIEGEVGTILRADAAMASDPAFVRAAHQLIDSEGVSGPAAVWRAAQTIIETLQHGRLAERAADLVGVRDRAIAELSGRQWPGPPAADHRYVLIADDLTPADAAELDGGSCAAIVTLHGGQKSHTTIIARRLGIPSVSNAQLPGGLTDGDVVRVDGAAQTVTRAD